MYMYTYILFNNLCLHFSCVWDVNNWDATGCTDALCHIHIPKVNSVWWETNVSICTANTAHHILENISSYCRQKLWLRLNLMKKMLSDEIFLSMDLTGFCATCHEPVLRRKGGSLRGKQRKGEEGWCRPSPTPTWTHIYCVAVNRYIYADW